MDEALAAYQQSVRVLRLITIEKPDDLKDQMALAEVLEALGDGSQVRHKNTEAVFAYEESRTIFAKIAPPTSASVSLLKERVGLLNRLSKLFTFQRQWDDALAILKEDTDFLQQLAAGEPHDPEWDRELTVAWEGVGYVYDLEQKLEDAVAAYRKAAGILDRLTSADPNNPELEESKAGTELTIAKLLLNKGDSEAAHAAFKASSDALFELSRSGRLDEQGRKWLEEADARLRQAF
jgi:tetratricopeptide (TPR) repeat protein